MLERLLERISLSKYRKNFILKGGMLISAIVGLDSRSTMDMDTTLYNLPLSEGLLLEAMEEIFLINIDDGVAFNLFWLIQ
ncbi:MAG: nucleotidyl transferase AbiEii/AbiGii toxin family protein [Clostridiaceae bacterium]|nr:nucleotidyl transferase AbiEii/AbiGii toxin family protein [Clostridiaceae bacterium]